MNHISPLKSKTELVLSSLNSTGILAITGAALLLVSGCQPQSEPPSEPTPAPKPMAKAPAPEAPKAEASKPAAPAVEMPKAPAMPKDEAASPATAVPMPPAPKMQAAPDTLVAEAPDTRSPMEKMLAGAQEKQNRLREISMQLQGMQDVAMKDEGLKTKMDALEAAAVELMVAESPTAKEDYDRFKVLLDELEAEPVMQQGDLSNLPPAIKAKFDEYQAIGEKLQPVQSKVSRDPKILTLQTNLMNDMKALMAQQNPEFEKLDAERESLMSELQEIQRAFQSQMMQQQLQQQIQQQMQGQGGDGPVAPPLPKVE